MSKEFIISSFKGGILQNRTGLVKLFRSLKDGMYEVSVSKISKRSNQQNRYYFGCVIPVIQKAMNDKGNEFSKEEIHDFLKGEFNYSDFVNHDTGEFKKVPRSTTALTKDEFSDYIQKIQRFAAESLQIVIPDPSTQTVFSYEADTN